MKQVVIIHGGDTFASYEDYLAFLKDFEIDFGRYFAGKKDWKGGLGEALGADYQVIAPSMPNKTNAKYLEWKIWFEKFLPHLSDGVILVGHSLGGTFLAKYLSEETMPVQVGGTFLVAPVFDGALSDESLADFVLPASLAKLQEQGGSVFLYHSEDDYVVPVVNATKLKEALPGATYRPFTDRGHFNQETFPEIVTDIRSL